MTSTPAKQYNDLTTLKRAERAVCCSPFQIELFRAMGTTSVPLPRIAQQSSVEHYTGRSLSEGRIERELVWLIKVGLLRREVDGQGITDSFRLTPLGRQLLKKWEHYGALPTPSWRDRLLNSCTRWWRSLL